MINGGLNSVSPISIAPTKNQTGKGNAQGGNLLGENGLENSGTDFENNLMAFNQEAEQNSNFTVQGYAQNSGSFVPSDQASQLFTVAKVPQTQANVNNMIAPMQVEALGETIENAEYKPMLKFLDSMERELGVEPERVVLAMSKLNDSQLLEPPASTMDEMLENLELEPWQQQRAAELYATMLQELNMLNSVAESSTPIFFQGNESFPKSQNFIAQDFEQLPVEEPLSLNDKIDRMNKKFFEVYPRQRFGRDPVNPSALTQQGDALAQQVPQEFFATENKNPSLINNMDRMEMVDPMYSEEQSDPTLLATSFNGETVNASTKAEQNSNQNLMSKLSALVASSEALKQGAGNNSGNMDQNFNQQQQAFTFKGQQNASDLTNMQSSQDLLDDFKSLNIQNVESSSLTESADSASTDTLESMSPLTSKNLSASDKLVEKSLDSALVTKTTSEADTPENSQEIVHNTRLLAKKGGGEMKVQLRPEGLGELQLKVAVNEGKVDVQMLTDNHAAKRALQSELNILKAGLNDNQLDLQSIKVDSSEGTSKFLQDQMNEQQRQHARQFLEEFRNNNFNERHGFAFDRGYKSYNKGQRSEEADELIRLQSNAKRSDRRLDVVA